MISKGNPLMSQNSFIKSSLSTINGLISYNLYAQTIKDKVILFFSFTLYPACSRVGWGNLVSNFHWILEALRVEWRWLNAAFCLDTRIEEIKIKYLISSNGNRTYYLSRLHSHVCAPTSRVVSLCYFYTNYQIKFERSHQ